MSDEMKVTVFWGPTNKFFELFNSDDGISLADVAYDIDDKHKTFRVVGIRETSKEIDELFYELVYASAEDFCSISAHCIENFSSVLQQIDTKHLYVNNPPKRVYSAIRRLFPKLEEEIYEYPTIDCEMLRRIKQNYSTAIIGQEEVLRRLLAMLYQLSKDKHRPIVLLFYGDSGVGKTETAKFLSKCLGGDLLRKQFSLFQNNEYSSYLFGGKHSDSSFARELLGRETNIVLLDEFDKANSVFYSAFYQLFDEGVFEDTNYRCNFGNGLIICTSNYQSDKEILDKLGEAIYSRFNAVIGFNKLSIDDMKRVIEMVIGDEASKFTDSELSPNDIDKIYNRMLAFAPKLRGVRNIKNLVSELFSLVAVDRLFEKEDINS